MPYCMLVNNLKLPFDPETDPHILIDGRAEYGRTRLGLGQTHGFSTMWRLHKLALYVPLLQA